MIQTAGAMSTEIRVMRLAPVAENAYFFTRDVAHHKAAVMNKKHETDPVQISRTGRAMSIVLNRPRAINSLTYKMILSLTAALEDARADDSVRMVVLSGRGEKGFCAGGDIKELYAAIGAGRPDEALEFFRAEYALDLMIHEYDKPVVVIADGITMGGGLGLAAGADIVIATERTLMAMPETRIGFFPDVGATGWLHEKCPPGYPEFLGLTGYELHGAQCVRLGMAHLLVDSKRVPGIVETIAEADRAGDEGRASAARHIARALEEYRTPEIAADPEMDDWVRAYFHEKGSLLEMIAGLRTCAAQRGLCEAVFRRLAERSPTALALTRTLLAHNAGRPLARVFASELEAARFIIGHPDYREGVRARIIDRDDAPAWRPAALEDARIEGLEL